MELIFATNNKNKVNEIQKLLPSFIKLKDLSDLGLNEDIPETGITLEENAVQKSNFIHRKFNLNCFSDDTGLEIEALNGEPGVYSARYAGESRNAIDNMNLVLEKLKNEKNRKARFRTVISLILENKEYLFEGVVEGKIEEIARGQEGFGYDPVFTPVGYNKTFAELSMDEKNKISHRALAFKKLIEFLKLQ